MYIRDQWIMDLIQFSVIMMKLGTMVERDPTTALTIAISITIDSRTRLEFLTR